MREAAVASGVGWVCGNDQFRATDCREDSSSLYGALRCPACDPGFVHSHPPAEALAGAYDGTCYVARQRGRLRRERLWRRRLRALLRDGATGPLLDVGCGDGGFLRPGGLLVVAVPNTDDRVLQWACGIARGGPPRLFAPDDRELRLFRFTQRSLHRLLEQAGLVGIRVGPHHAQVEAGKVLVDRVPTLVFAVLRRAWWSALLAWTSRPPGA